jgi:hypothetical protein
VAEDSLEEKKRKGIVLNTVLNTVRIVRSFSIQQQDLRVLNEFQVISRREAGPRGFSETILKAMKEYNHKHGEGNPQLKIATYLDSNAASPVRVLCYAYLAGATSDGKVYCRKYGGAWIQSIRCYSCSSNQFRKQEPSK